MSFAIFSNERLAHLPPTRSSFGRRAPPPPQGPVADSRTSSILAHNTVLGRSPLHTGGYPNSSPSVVTSTTTSSLSSSQFNASHHNTMMMAAQSQMRNTPITRPHHFQPSSIPNSAVSAAATTSTTTSPLSSRRLAPSFGRSGGAGGGGSRVHSMRTAAAVVAIPSWHPPATAQGSFTDACAAYVVHHDDAPRLEAAITSLEASVSRGRSAQQAKRLREEKSCAIELEGDNFASSIQNELQALRSSLQRLSEVCRSETDELQALCSCL
ncbi:Hypothetical protein, putative [Bodo saltans]|uniref:Uncharacterized protein n=1 Tax=Bodo saltans TaxID=75058 RepID=A0A0S4JNA9_BODSA|nr:Hypothetical protein, putative [Bodo saltans]|eukprot:CUG93006.1 Hypothetical protein, putative [Bodo saltans]